MLQCESGDEWLTILGSGPRTWVAGAVRALQGRGWWREQVSKHIDGVGAHRCAGCSNTSVGRKQVKKNGCECARGALCSGAERSAARPPQSLLLCYFTGGVAPCRRITQSSYVGDKLTDVPLLVHALYDHSRNGNLQREQILYDVASLLVG